MELGILLNHLYPQLKNSKDYLVIDKGDGKGAVLAEWYTTDFTKPTDEQLQLAWEEYQSNPPEPKLSEVEQLAKDQADLMFTLVMKGVL